jgi:Carboxypeptidase regulatory-like domain/TonB dependent receptor
MIAGKFCNTTKAIWALLLFAGVFVASAHAQSTFGSVVGTVQDATQALVPEATVTLHSLDDNSDRVTTSNSTGEFQFVNLKPGHYSVISRASGMSDAKVAAFDLAPRQTARVNVVMTVQSQSQTVQVSAAATLISTDKPTLDTSKDNSAIVQLPLNSRAATSSPLSSLNLLPNVQTDNQGNIALAGATANMVNYSVDGISTTDIFHNGALKNAYPSQENIAEVKATDFNNSPEFAQVGDVTFTTKGGSNAFHGSLFEYLQNDALDAKVFGFSTKAPKRYNDFGGSFSGPVTIPHFYDGKDKTFFFFDYEGNRRATSTPELLVVPTADQRAGNLNGLPIGNSSGTLQNPLPAGAQCSGVQFTNNAIPTQCINPVATALLRNYPMPTPGLDLATLGYNYQALVPIPGNSNGFDIRIDHNINDKQQIYARFSWKNNLTDVFNQILPVDADIEHDRSFLVSHNYSITPRIVNEFRYGYTHSLINPNFPINGTQALDGLGFSTGTNPDQINTSNHLTAGGFPTFNFSDGTSFSTIGRDITGVQESNTKQLTDNITITKGSHTFRAGIDFRIVNFVSPSLETPSDDFGLFNFNQGIFTGSSFGDLLLGLPNNTYFAVTGPRDDATGHQYGIYAQDQWEINSHLTLNYGLRWEYLPGFQDALGNMANFIPATNTVVVPDRVLKGIGVVPAFLQSFNSCTLPDRDTNIPCSNFESASQAHIPQSLRQNYKRNFDPRIGLAYRPFSDSKTVIRAGFGIFSVTNLGPFTFNMSSLPTASVHTYQNKSNSGVPQFQFPQTLSASQAVALGGGLLEQGDDPNYRDPQVIQWNVTVEREITGSTAARFSYVGMEAHRQNVTVDLNQVPESTQPYVIPSGGWVDPRAPFQNWGPIYQSTNLGSTAYNAFQAGITHRLSHGLTFQGDYTWAKNLSDVQGDAPTGFAIESFYGLAVSDRFHVNANRGNVEGTPRQRFLLTGTYELPYGRGRQFGSSNRFLNAAFGGWNVNTITLLQTGPWLTPTMSASNDQSGVGISQRGTIARPDRVPGVSTSPAHRSAAQYFNPAAFTHDVPAGRTGNSAVGSLEGPGTAAVAAGLAKVFDIREGVRLRFESTFTNIINHTNFNIPATNIDNSNFGVLTSAQTANNAGNRTGQVALRLDF